LQTPKAVLIEEAVKNAKNFDEENGHKFINGILNETLA
jgi:transcription termination factor NusB